MFPHLAKNWANPEVILGKSGKALLNLPEQQKKKKTLHKVSHKTTFAEKEHNAHNSVLFRVRCRWYFLSDHRLELALSVRGFGLRDAS